MILLLFQFFLRSQICVFSVQLVNKMRKLSLRLINQHTLMTCRCQSRSSFTNSQSRPKFEVEKEASFEEKINSLLSQILNPYVQSVHPQPNNCTDRAFPVINIACVKTYKITRIVYLKSRVLCFPYINFLLLGIYVAMWCLLTHSLPQSTLVDLTFQSRSLRSFSLNQLRNLSLQAGNLHSSFSISS